MAMMITISSAAAIGGLTAGVIVMLLCGTTNVREISLFPLNQQAMDLLMGAPSEVAPKQLRELRIRLNLPGEGVRLAFG